MARIVLLDPLDVQHENTIDVADTMIIRFQLGNEWVEIRHKDTYLEVHRTTRQSGGRLTIEPRFANEVWIRIEQER